MNYKSYLKSDTWLDKKRELERTEIKMCWVCYAKKKKLDVHHLTYNNLGNEKIDQLIYLCRIHHLKLSYWKKKFPNKSDFDILIALKGKKHFKSIMGFWSVPKERRGNLIKRQFNKLTKSR